MDIETDFTNDGSRRCDVHKRKMIWPIFRRIVAIPPAHLDRRLLGQRDHDVRQDHPCAPWHDDPTMQIMSHGLVCTTRGSGLFMRLHPTRRAGSGRSFSKFFFWYLSCDFLKMLEDRDRVMIPMEPHSGAGLSKRYAVICSQLGLQSNGFLEAQLARFSGSLFLCRERCLRRGQDASRQWRAAHQRCPRDGGAGGCRLRARSGKRQCRHCSLGIACVVWPLSQRQAHTSVNHRSSALAQDLGAGVA
jgi:hypothetical protein